MSLLQKLPSLQDVVNQVIQEEREKEEKGEVSPVASNLSIDDDDEHDASFQSCAANLLLASLQEDDPKLQEERYDNLLVAYTGACTELASAAVAGTSSSAPEELVKLERRIEHLQGLNRKLKAQLRLKWAAMIKMAKFVFVDDDVIDRSLEPVIRIGWDGFKWNKGYSLLHYAADCVTDPEVVELMANLATDVDQKDDYGLRPIDYARKTQDEAVIKALERMRKAARKLAQEEADLKEQEMDEPIMKERNTVKEPGRTEEKPPRSPRVKEAAEVDVLGQRALPSKDQPAEADVDLRRRRTEREAANGGALEVKEQRAPENAPSPGARREEMQQVPLGATEASQPISSAQASPVRRQSVIQEEILANAREKLKNATDMKPALSKAVAKVLNKGWEGVSWPSNFSAVHVAAKLGDATWPDRSARREELEVKAIEILAEAAQNGNQEAVAALQHHLAKAEERAAEQAAQAAQQAEQVQWADGASAERPTSPSHASPVDPGPVPEGIRPELQKACQVVKKKGAVPDLTVQDRIPTARQHWTTPREKERFAERQYVAWIRCDGEQRPHEKELVRKGTSAAPAAEGAKAAEDTDSVPEVKDPAAEAAPKAKGKAKGPPKGPGKGKAAQTEEAKESKEETKEEAKEEPKEGAPKGKGPKGPAKGKGPPAPGGKGPPAPAGKGPAPPGGKGPAPAGKGGPAAGGKAGKAGKGAKGGAGGGSGETKPVVKPSQPMKPLWWSKMIFGAQLKKGESIWDEVKDDMEKLPLEELTERFSKSAAAREKPKKEKAEGKKEELKSLRIITDPQIVVGKEASLKKLPEPTEVARALDELDDTVLNPELLQVVKDNACPTPAQMKELGEARTKNPNVPLALPESFMWVIGQMPAYQQRIDCWSFAMTYKEQHATYHTALSDFLQVVECFQESEMLPTLLGIILAVGNYLNGGTNRGQADGFDIESLAKLEGIKDATGKDIRHFIFDLFLNRMTEQSTQFVEELMPCMVNMNRRISKDSDGVEKLDKSAKIAFEDFDLCVTALHSEFVQKHEMMQMILSYFEDPADPFKLQMPKIYLEAKDKLDELNTLKDTAKAQVLKWFKVQAMKSNEFCLLWDNLLIPANMIINADMKMKKEFMLPTFCQNKPFSAEDLQILWSFKEFDGKRTVKKKTKERRRRRFSQRLRDGAEAAAAAEAKAAGAAAPAEGAPAVAPGVTPAGSFSA
ncbi:unnamed protein product [Durusdinium trenchii]|uniref:FH2 domain-containing protein n=1 Tax=Durusdinium trenchii TaxID=1381693 RepID=A0ABP0SIL4_9DINO